MRTPPNHDQLDAREQQIAELQVTLRVVQDELSSKDASIQRLRAEIEKYRKLLFGKSSERRAPDPVEANGAQGHLFAALLAEANAVAARTAAEGAIEETSEARPKKRGRRRKTFPDDTPVYQTTYEIPESERECTNCGDPLHEIGEKVTKELERIELTFVHEIHRKKYGCRTCCGHAVTAPGPSRVIEGGLLGPGFLAHLITERFLNHMPYHRQQKKYESEGLEISRTVLERSASTCAELLKPIYEQIGREIFAGDLIFTDDTPVTIAKGSEGNSRKGRIWIYADKEGGHFYDFTESRKRDGPAKILAKYDGYIHADAYPGYDRLFLPGGATEVACLAHVRRKFTDAEDEEPELAKQVLDLIRGLYAVERAGTEAALDADQRHELRQQKSRPILKRFTCWLEFAWTQVLPKSVMGDAIRYARNQLVALHTFLEDGRLEIDNNRAERAMRPVAVGRKNWMFFQNPKGGENAAILLSLVRSAYAIGVDPRVYLRDVLTRIAVETDVAKLSPRGWKQHYAGGALREYAMLPVPAEGREES